MCLIVHAPRGVRFNEDVLNQASLENPDGYGCSYSDGSNVFHFRGLNMQEGVARALTLPIDAPRLVHFRFRTNGPRTRTNCHPFVTECGQYVAYHNGIIPQFSKDEAISDSRRFVREFLSPLVSMVSPGSANFAKVMNGFDPKSRFAIQGVDGVWLYGDWIKHGGLWYSKAQVLMVKNPQLGG